MLVLTRKQQEKIKIGDDITITILRTKGKSVRIGIEAPGTVPVLRGELVAERQAPEPPAGTGPAAEALPGTEHSHQSTMPATAKPRGERREQHADGWAPTRQNAEPQATLHRVPRSRVEQVLPRMLDTKAGAAVGPLRSMLDRRSAGVQV